MGCNRIEAMGYIPLFYDVTAKPCVVIGGGHSAEERVRSLLAAEAEVTVIAPVLTAGLAELAAAGRVHHRNRAFCGDDLRGFELAWCYEHEVEITHAVANAARALRVLLNIADRPAMCSFIAPAVVKRGALQVAISTGGASPALAGLIRQELEASIGPEYAGLLTILAKTRQWLRRCQPDAAQRARLGRLLARELRDAVVRGDEAAVDEVLTRHLGVTLARLGLEASLDHRVPAAGAK
jgi:siroheme synthase-like protein